VTDQKSEREYTFDRHDSVYRTNFEQLTADMQTKCPVAWNQMYGGYWYAAGNRELFDIVRAGDVLSAARDPERGYVGVAIPSSGAGGLTPSFLEMDPPDQRYYRQTLNPYLSPAAVARWKPFVAEVTRAALNERIETGTIDFVEDLANVVPAVVTMAMMGLPLVDWHIYSEPVHALVYTKPDSPDVARVMNLLMVMKQRLFEAIDQVRREPRPGIVEALATCALNGRTPSDEELTAQLGLVISGGFDTTTALTAHSLEWLGEHPDERARLAREHDTLIDSATEEFLRYFAVSTGDGRTFAQDATIDGIDFKEGERIWLSWAMANRDPEVFANPNEVILDRSNNRHSSFGLGIHRCIGSNVARMTFKTMLAAVLERIPDYVCDPVGAVHYDTVGIINGMKNLPATFTPGPRRGIDFETTIAALQKACDEQRLAEPVTARRQSADLAGL
jgi:cytochrome P450